MRNLRVTRDHHNCKRVNICHFEAYKEQFLYKNAPSEGGLYNKSKDKYLKCTKHILYIYIAFSCIIFVVRYIQ